MELIERAGFLASLQTKFQNITDGEGHCIFISGEAGIGKTSLVKAFCKLLKDKCKIYQGICDALFTPRPLAPLYDILLQLGSGLPANSGEMADRTAFFTGIFQALSERKAPSLLIFEDIHWADEATLDFIKFLARRITQLPCLFILTYREDEVHVRHPLRNVLGQLHPASFTRLPLPPLSRQAVDLLATEKGYSGEDVYSISGGNPFYVNEILASYSLGVPDNIRNSIISTYSRQEEQTKQVWELLSVIPAGFEVKNLEKFNPAYGNAIERCLESGILLLKDGKISFKHELFRRTIETSLSPFKRLSLNKKILEMFLEGFELKEQIERIIHHARNANEYELVVRYAPLAASQAAAVGAHIEAARLYLVAIEYYQGDDMDTLIRFYESYAYECYLTNQVKEAIIYSVKALNLWKKKDDTEKIGNCMRFLSRLWWFDGNRKKAESFARQAIEVLEPELPSRAKAMAYSNMSQLKMLSDEHTECIIWGEQAITMAKELSDQEILSHALNNVGDVHIRIPSTRQKGIMLLQESLNIALQNSYHEHVARAYTNLGHNGVLIKEYEFANDALEAGIRYCEERDLDSWTAYMVSNKARLKLETGHWNEACQIAEKLISNDEQTPVVKIGALLVVATVKMRRGETEVLPLLTEAKQKAFETMELQRIIPAMVAMLEYEWIMGENFIENESLDSTIRMVGDMGNIYENSEFAFWLFKARKQYIHLRETFEGYQLHNKKMALKAAQLWEEVGRPYEQALALFEGDDEDKRKAISIIYSLGAQAVYEKLKFEMKASGITKIPRGIRKSTQSNPALLTDRELDVLQLVHKGLQNKEIANRLFISAKTVDHHISAILFKLDVNSRIKAAQEAARLGIIK